jgi:hypothetical protein
VLDVTLAPGDTLYLPRGWLHEAKTSDSDSLHLTIGVNVYTWLDAFKAALDDCGDEVAFRRSTDTAGDGLVELLASRLGRDDVERRRRRKLVRTRRPILSGQLKQLRALADLDSSTEIERRPTALADLELRGDRAVLSFDGRTLELPGRVHRELEYMLAGEPFTPADLPGRLDDKGRLVLVGRLVREGLLQITSP